jgi:Tol biopolymer transport system component
MRIRHTLLLSALFILTVALACGTAEPTATPAPTETPPPPLSGSRGGAIVFYSERDGNAEIYLMSVEDALQGTGGSDQQRLTYNEADDFSPAWSPDGTQIAFISDRDDPNPRKCFPECTYKIYIMGADGGSERRLTDTPAGEHHPAWSPDGTQLTFDSDQDGDGNGEIYVINADGSGQLRLTDSQANDLWADWSPDGTHIVFCSDRDGNYAVYVMNVEDALQGADGTNQRRLTDNDVNDYFPAWSPDGTKIAYFSMGPGSRRQDIFVMNSDGTDVRQLTDTPSRVDEGPAWSPDGTQIVFQSDRDGNFEIYVMNADGSDHRRLTSERAGDYWPHWRP